MEEQMQIPAETLSWIYVSIIVILDILFLMDIKIIAKKLVN